MHWTSLLALGAGLADALPSSELLEARQFGGGQRTTMLRFGCAQVVIDRLDPLVNPATIPSPHVHQIVGGNGFNASMTTGDVSATATCTTCEFSEDFSNYWTANLYFKARNGTYKRVPQLGAAQMLTPILGMNDDSLQFGDQYSTKIGGGVLVYYVSAAPGQITAFKPGFRMLVGDVNKRTAAGGNKMQNCYRCYTGPNFGGDYSAPCADGRLDTAALPTAACKGGIRSNILFPTCWDGKNLDSPNHQDHVAYPTSGPANFLSLGGACPASHTGADPAAHAEWPADGSQPFYFSQGDNTGYGQHADYVFGWKDDSLQKAMDTAGCMGAKCGALKTQQIDAGKGCSVKPLVNEDHDGWIKELPGMDMSRVEA
ncbi:hypothetical protein PG994_009954 [Apiospora phragmitis]|uniref:DUF1996 domain-containing protein n=1 Tax=Apiospora phragmitis TaxID=2905665 RepID=A0ABR1TNI4_9PEZI